MSFNEFANFTGFTTSYIYKLENGKINPTFKSINQFCKTKCTCRIFLIKKFLVGILRRANNLEQLLDVSLSIPIPADKILISRVELQELREQSLSGVYWNMKDLEKRQRAKASGLKKTFYTQVGSANFRFSKRGFVFYPQAKGQNWSFQASKMAAF